MGKLLPFLAVLGLAASAASAAEIDKDQCKDISMRMQLQAQSAKDFISNTAPLLGVPPTGLSPEAMAAREKLYAALEALAPHMKAYLAAAEDAAYQALVCSR